MEERKSSKSKNPLVGIILGISFILLGIAYIVMYGQSEKVMPGYMFIILGLGATLYCTIIMERKNAPRKNALALTVLLMLSICL